MTGPTSSDEFAVVNICRSDGQDSGPGYWPAPADAAKKKAPLDKVPRAKPHMIRLAEDDPRFQEWRIKLGILLKQELNPTEGPSWLLNFPRGYWLYEKSKHLWVSGYPVKSKLFKSPQEFGLHLLWLLSNSTDRMDCRCIHCNVREMPALEELTVTEIPRPVPGPTNAQPPSKMRKITPQMPLSRTASPAPAAATPPNPKKETPVPVPTPALKKETPVPVPSIPPRAVTVPAPAPAPVQTSVQPPQVPVQVPAQAQPQPPPQPPAQPPAQALQPRVQTPTQQQQQPIAQAPYQQQTQFPPYPQQPHNPGALFRVGEMVWHQMSNGWRLGVVAATGIINPKNSKPEALQILPISHYLFGQLPVQLIEASARPFLAFSVPSVGIPELQSKAYDDVPWQQFLGSLNPEDTHRREVILLDSSKMAAQKIGSSYSLFTRLSTTEDGKKTDYQGIFLGAERVELGDVLRIRITTDQPGVPEAATNLSDALLGLREICTAVDMPGAVFFKGDIYQPITGDNKPVGGMPVTEDKLPRPLREESAFRNKFAPAERWRCVLLRHNAVLREGELKGRFYPTHKLLPLLDGQQKVGAEVQQGIVRDAQQRLNQRIDGFKTGYIGRKSTRAETIGPALPPGSAIRFGNEVREETEA
ncbi:hypothetical protein K4K56_001125 [Colletotrichum sp. SAR 10_98]|nr:hypothetical protein K4K56_001125 [Colletotrichum sp. SAR 10_98]